MAPQTSPSKNWCATWNNYPEDWKEKLEALREGEEPLIKYWIAGKEVAPTTDTPHLQMYIQLMKKQRQTALREKLVAGGVTAHLTKAKGKLSQNQVYCRKDGDWEEAGTPTGKGSRSDVLALRDKVLSGATDMEIAMDDSTCRASAQFARFTQTLRASQRAKLAQEALVEEYADAVLRDWQQDVVTRLDKYVPLPPAEFVLTRGEFGGTCLREMGIFDTHSYP